VIFNWPFLSLQGVFIPFLMRQKGFLGQAREITCHLSSFLNKLKIRYKTKTSFPEFIQAKRIFYLFLKAG